MLSRGDRDRPELKELRSPGRTRQQFSHLSSYHDDLVASSQARVNSVAHEGRYASVSASRSFFGWVGGIVATIVGGVIVVWLTTAPTPPPGPQPTSTVEVTTTPAAEALFDLKITDQLTRGWTSEQITIVIDGTPVGTLTADTSHTTDSLTIRDLAPGKYTYELTVTGYFLNELGEAISVDGYGSGTVALTAPASFAVIMDVTESGIIALSLS
jgi:hypothetical protein